MSQQPTIRAENVSKKFCRHLKRALWYGVCDVGRELLGRNGHQEQLRPGEFWAVDDVSFEVRPGESLGLIGANGAGKSTLLKMLNGLLKPDRGRIAVRGRVGALIELGTGFNPILSGRENIYNNGAVLGLPKREIDARLEEIIAFAEIGDAIDAPVQGYSSGMKVRLGFAVAAHLKSNILLVDEVLAVGDARFRSKCMRLMRELTDRGTSLIFVSHNMSLVCAVCNRALWCDQGRIRSLGPPEAVCGEYELDANRGRKDEIAASDTPCRILSAKFDGPDSGDTASIDDASAGPLDVAVEYQCSRAMESLYFNVALDTSANGTYYRRFFPLPRQYAAAGRYRLVLRIPTACLLPGVHALTFAMTDCAGWGRFLHKLPYHLAIVVRRGASESFGCVEIVPEIRSVAFQEHSGD